MLYECLLYTCVLSKRKLYRYVVFHACTYLEHLYVQSKVFFVEEEQLMSATISGVNLQQATHELFPAFVTQSNSTSSLSPEDIFLRCFFMFRVSDCCLFSVYTLRKWQFTQECLKKQANRASSAVISKISCTNNATYNLKG